MSMKTLMFTECVELVGSACKAFSGTKKYVSTGAVDVDHINESDTEIVDYEGKPSRANLDVMAGDILFAKMQGTKKTLMIDSVLADHIYSTGFCAVRAKEGILTKRCLYHLLTSEMFLSQKDKNCSGATQKAITNAGLGKIAIQVPSINKQDGIADQLDAIKSIITKRRQELKALDELIKARFVEMFGSFDLALQKAEWVPISQIGTVVGGSTPKTGVAEYWDGEYRWISPAELKADSGIIYDSVKKITKAGVDSCSLQELPIGTVILSSRAPIGKVAIAGNTFYCNQGFKNVICNDRVLPRYLYTLLLFNTEFLNSLGRGATFKEISKAIVENIRIPLPSFDRQQRFDSFVVQVDKSKVVVQKSLDEAQLLFDSLMQQYFG
ncbi:MAG: restriction endonuclease subunit S [Clostridia bacterium]|nr:restriction endonuclease subunit S [Clostridia bacterium]